MTDDDRLADLEAKFAFQQETIDVLNETVTKQWTEIDRLSRALGMLKAQILDLDDGGPADQKPPHY